MEIIYFIFTIISFFISYIKIKQYNKKSLLKKFNEEHIKNLIV